MIEYAMLTEKGDRELNEDSIGMCEKNGNYCFMVADGLGGHGKGDVASKLVIDSAANKFYNLCELKGDIELIRILFDSGQETLLNYQKSVGTIGQLKTTMSIVCVNKDNVVYGHIGDTRIYLFKNKKLICRTTDHSVVQMLVKIGEVEETQIRNHPDRNRLLKCMGVEWETPEYRITKLLQRKSSMQLLVCSDGFWEFIQETEMEKCLKMAGSVKKWLDSMQSIVLKTEKNKDMDNYSAIAIWVD